MRQQWAAVRSTRMGRGRAVPLALLLELGQQDGNLAVALLDQALQPLDLIRW